MNSQPSTLDSQPVCLTDKPRVVALRREFVELDGRVEVLKIIRDSPHASPEKKQHAVAELTAVNERKAAIATEISTIRLEMEPDFLTTDGHE